LHGWLPAVRTQRAKNSSFSRQLSLPYRPRNREVVIQRFLSKHEAIVADLPERARCNCSTGEACSVIGGLLTDSRSAVRLAAVRELAALLLSDERAALSDHSHVAAVFGYAASHFDHDDLRKLTERGLGSLTNKDRTKVAEQLLLGKAKSPLALRLALVRTLRNSSIYHKVAIELLKEDHTDDPNYEVATEVLEEALKWSEGRRRFEVAATAVCGIRETEGPGYAVRERAAKAIVGWWTRSPGLTPEEQTGSFQELLKRGYVVAVLEVILPALLPGWSQVQIGSVLKDMARHGIALVRCAAASQLHQHGMIDAELQRRLLLDKSFLVVEQIWQDQGSGVIPVEFLIQAAKGALPSFRDREADAEKRAKIKNDALECLRRKIPSLSGEERASVEAVLPLAEIAPQKEREDLKRGCPSCGFSYGWNGSECRHCGRGKK